MSLALVCVAGIGIVLWRILTPEVVVINGSSTPVSQVTIHLPASRLVFNALAPGEKATIYYSTSQTDGIYRYAIEFADAPTMRGSCGRVNDSQYGKRFILTVNSPSATECEESYKL